MTLTSKLLAATALVLLSGCGKETATKEVVETTTTIETPAPNTIKYDLYLISLQMNLTQTRDWDETDLLEVGEAVCDAFGTGKTLPEVVDIFRVNLGGLYGDELFSSIIGSSVTFLCPEFAVYVDGKI